MLLVWKKTLLVGSDVGSGQCTKPGITCQRYRSLMEVSRGSFSCAGDTAVLLSAGEWFSIAPRLCGLPGAPCGLCARVPHWRMGVGGEGVRGGGVVQRFRAGSDQEATKTHRGAISARPAAPTCGLYRPQVCPGGGAGGGGAGRGGDLVPTMPVCVCRKVKDMGPFLASSE